MTIRNLSGRTVGLVLFVLFALGAAVPALEHRQGPPALILGDFIDDYGNHYTVTPTEFLQRPRASYVAVRWDSAGEFLIARNGANNPGDANLFSRIDWMPLTGMAPFEWAFCLSAYNAPSAAAAESTHVAKRETPKTGCNGFPFSRMKRWSRTPG